MFLTKPENLRTPKVLIPLKSACSLEDGYWICVDCNESFKANTDAMNHNEKDLKHKIIWYCRTHGFEAGSVFNRHSN